MKRWLPFLMTLVSPPLASALEKEDGGAFNLLASFIQMLAALALVIGVILLIQALTKRWVKMRGGSGEARHIRLVETRYLAPKKSLLLVEVGGEYLLLSDGNEGVRLIKQVEVKEEVGIALPGQGGSVHAPSCSDHGGSVAGIWSVDHLRARPQRTEMTIKAGWLLLVGSVGKLPLDYFHELPARIWNGVRGGWAMLKAFARKLPLDFLSGLPTRIRLINRVGWIILKALAARLPLDFFRGIPARIRSSVQS